MENMTLPAQAVPLGGDALMAHGAWRHNRPMVVIAAGWSRGLLPASQPLNLARITARRATPRPRQGQSGASVVPARSDRGRHRCPADR